MKNDDVKKYLARHEDGFDLTRQLLDEQMSDGWV